MTPDDLRRQARAILVGNPHTPPLYRLLAPCDWTETYYSREATRDRLWPDNKHERERPVCKVKR